MNCCYWISHWLLLYQFTFIDSGVESSTTYAGHDGGAISDCELTQSQSIDEVGASPAPTLEDAMQRLAETIKEFDSHAMTDEDKSPPKNDDTITITRQEQNVSQGQIFLAVFVIPSLS